MDHILRILILILPVVLHGQVAVFDNVAQMRRNAAYLSTGSVVSTRGYYSQGDGGAGVYRITAGTTTENGINHNLNETSRHALFVWNGQISLEQAGAKGDGSTNDKTIFQAVASYVNSKGGGLVEGKSDRNYYISSTTNTEVFYELCANTTIDLKNAKISTNSSVYTRYLFYADGGEADSNIVIRNLKLYCTASDSVDRVESSTIVTSNVVPINVVSSTSKNFVLDNIYVSGTKGFYVRGKNFRVSNCTVVNSATGFFVGEDSTEVYFNNIKIDRSQLTGVGNFDHGFYLSGAKTVMLSNISIKGSGSTERGLPFSIRNNVTSIQAVNITLDSCQEIGVGADEATFSNLIIKNPQSAGLFDLTGADEGESTINSVLVASVISIDSHMVNFPILKNGSRFGLAKLSNVVSRGPVRFVVDGVGKTIVSDSYFKDYLPSDSLDVLSVGTNASLSSDEIAINNCEFVDDTSYTNDQNLFYVTSGRLEAKDITVKNNGTTNLGPLFYARNTGTVISVYGVDTRNITSLQDTLLGGLVYVRNWNKGDTTDAVFGEMYIDDTDPDTISFLGGSTTPAQGTDWLAGELQNFTYSNGRLTYTGTQSITVKIDASISFSFGENSTTIEGWVYKTGSEVSKSEFHRQIGTGGDVDNSGISCLLTLATNDYIELFFAPDAHSGNDNLIIQNANVNVTRIK